MTKYVVEMYERDETTNWQWQLYPEFTREFPSHKEASKCAKEHEKMYLTSQVKFEVKEVK